jgi:hypothetical protein
VKRPSRGNVGAKRSLVIRCSNRDLARTARSVNTAMRLCRTLHQSNFRAM